VTVRPASARASAVSSERATSIASSSRAPISAWASGRSGCSRTSPASMAGREDALDQAESVAGSDLAPLLPTEHRRGVEEDDPLDLRFEAGVEEHLGARVQRLERAGAGGHGSHQPGRELGLDLLVGGAQEAALVLEVVVEGAAGDAGSADDLLGADRGIATLGEQVPSGGDQRFPGGLRARSLRASLAPRRLGSLRCPSGLIRPASRASQVRLLTCLRADPR
jgi:hypothetical protein